MKTEQQIQERLDQWKEMRKERQKNKQDYYLESCMIAAFEWVLEE